MESRSLPSDLSVSRLDPVSRLPEMSTETMRFSSYFLAEKATVLFDLVGLGFPTLTAIVKIFGREFTECGSQCLKSVLCSHWSC